MVDTVREKKKKKCHVRSSNSTALTQRSQSGRNSNRNCSSDAKAALVKLKQQEKAQKRSQFAPENENGSR